MADKKTYYITTPIYYPRISFIGHTYTTVADAAARFKRMLGYDVMFLPELMSTGRRSREKQKKRV